MGIVRACADIVGAALLARCGITLLRWPFASGEGATCLHLNLSKCKIGTFAKWATARDATRVRAILAAWAPRWVRFGIVDAGLSRTSALGSTRLLARYIGERRWPIGMRHVARWQPQAPRRARPAKVSNTTRALSTLWYAAHLFPPPVDIEKLEACVINCVLRLRVSARRPALSGSGWGWMAQRIRRHVEEQASLREARLVASVVGLRPFVFHLEGVAPALAHDAVAHEDAALPSVAHHTRSRRVWSPAS